MDVVILAAGRGERLNGIAAPYHKPLLVVNGKSLVANTARMAAQASHGEVIVVVAPENALPIAQVLNAANVHADLIVQRQAMGPGHALMQGLKLVTTSQVLVLLGDNVMTYKDIVNVVNSVGNSVGITLLDGNEAEQFTRQRNDDSWVEKVPVTEQDLDNHGMVHAWVGPIKVDVQAIKSAILAWMNHDGGDDWDEIPIGPLFNKLENIKLVHVTSIDIGSPESFG